MQSVFLQHTNYALSPGSLISNDVGWIQHNRGCQQARDIAKELLEGHVTSLKSCL
jgi:hypothetical protein